MPTATKNRGHLRAVPDPRRVQDVVSLHEAAAKLAERRERIAHQQRHARQAAAMPDVVKDRDLLITKTLHRLKMPGADQRALLAEFADAMFIAGYMDDAAEERDGLADAALGTIINFESIEKRLRDEANLMLHPSRQGGDPA